MTDSSPRFALLRARYARSFASKQATLALAWRAFADGADAASAREVQGLVHRLAGSAPAYGYAKLGARASAIDRELMNWEGADRAHETAGELAKRLSAPMQSLMESLALHAAEAADEPIG